MKEKNHLCKWGISFIVQMTTARSNFSQILAIHFIPWIKQLFISNNEKFINRNLFLFHYSVCRAYLVVIFSTPYLKFATVFNGILQFVIFHNRIGFIE